MAQYDQGGIRPHGIVDVTSVMRASPQARGRARLAQREAERATQQPTLIQLTPGLLSRAQEAGELVRAAAELVRAAAALPLPMPHYGEARLYCDMDGVAADFDRHYNAHFGKRRARHTDWADVRSVPDFFLTIPMMEDFPALWAYIAPYRPIFLTGCPSSVSPAANHKVQWLHEHLGPEIPVICCRAKLKRLYCRPGDFLIDDSEEHRPLWEQAGGIWIPHLNAADTIAALKDKGFA